MSLHFGISRVAFLRNLDGGAGGGGAGAGDGSAGGAAAGGGAAQTTTTARPDYIPEKFWIADKSQPNVEALGRSYGELERKFSTRNDDLLKEHRPKIEAEVRGAIFANRPAKAEEYKNEFPADYKLPEGIEFGFDDKSPLMAEFKKLAHERGFSQGEFSKALQLYSQDALGRLPDPAAEMKKLGENGKERAEAVKVWAEKHLGKDSPEMTALWNHATTGEAVVALEKLMKVAGQGGGTAPAAGANGAGTAGGQGAAKSEAELFSMKLDKRYSGGANERDPGYIAHVEAEYKRAYPGKITFGA